MKERKQRQLERMAINRGWIIPNHVKKEICDNLLKDIKSDSTRARSNATKAFLKMEEQNISIDAQNKENDESITNQVIEVRYVDETGLPKKDK